jgi:hypothetical protein
MRSDVHPVFSFSRVLLVATLLLGLATGCQQDVSTPATITALPEVSEDLASEAVVREMAAFMGQHMSYKFEAEVTYQSLQESGQMLSFDMLQHVAVSQPDRLFWVTTNDDAQIDSAWFDAGTFSMLKQPDNISGQVDVPATIPEMIDALTSDYGLVVPFSDLLAGGDEPVFLRDLQDSEYFGLAWVDGRWSHHLALRNEIVDYQIWVQAEGDPVPLRIAITWKLEEGLPEYVSRFANWDFSPVFTESMFEFGNRTEGERIDILPMVFEEEVAP